MGKKASGKAPKQASGGGLLDKLTSLVFLLFLCSLLVSHLSHS